ncbi:MAG: 50S ribosomal protein L1 [Armatimonadota bacterium]
MGKTSKRLAKLNEEVRSDSGPRPLAQAVALAKKTGNANFDETIEVAVRLGVSASRGEETVRGTLTLPHGTGKTPRVAVFAKGEAAQEAEEAGADRVGAEDLVEAIEQGWDEFDVLVAQPDVMRIVGRLGKKLGPRMPSKKAGNITPNVGDAVRELKAGKVEFRMDKAAILHVPIGKASFEEKQLEDNLKALLAAVVRARPAAAKGRYVVSISLSATMGPGIAVDVQDALAAAA